MFLLLDRFQTIVACYCAPSYALNDEAFSLYRITGTGIAACVITHTIISRGLENSNRYMTTATRSLHGLESAEGLKTAIGFENSNRYMTRALEDGGLGDVA